MENDLLPEGGEIMSIREVLKRGPIKRSHTEYNSRDSNEEEAVLAKADLLLQEAGIPEILFQLVEIIRPNFPDVKISERRVYVGGCVKMGLEWNFRKLPEDKGQSMGKYQYSRLNISVLPIREEIVIGKEVLARKQWASKDIVEDSIVVAYKNPEKWVGPPVRL